MVSQRNLIIVVAIVAVVAIGTIGVYVNLPSVTSSADKTTFIEDTIGEPRRVDPARVYDTAGGQIIENCYETLVYLDRESSTEVRPVLAQSWEVSADGLTYTFVLRQGIKFQDGTPMNASTVKWSLDRVVLINAAGGPAWMLCQSIKGAWPYFENTTLLGEKNRTKIYEAAKAYLDANGVEVVSNYVVKIHVSYQDTGKAYPAFKLVLCGSWASIVSPSYVLANGGSVYDTQTSLTNMSMAKYLSDKYSKPMTLASGLGIVPRVLTPSWMLTHTCGTGPFNLVEWTKTQRLVLERNENYWGGPDGAGLANFTRVIINRVDDFGTRKVRFLAGESDHTYWGSLYADQLIDVNTRTALPQYKGLVNLVLDQPQIADEAVQLEMNATLADVTTTVNKDPALGPHENPLQYPEFRQAMQYSFDRVAYLDSLNGFGTICNSPIIKGMVGYSPDVPVYTYDPVKAKALFDAVGWSGTLNVYYNAGNDLRKKAALILKDGVEGITTKVHINVQEVDWPTMLDNIVEPGWALFICGWLADYMDADDNAVAYASSGAMGTFAYPVGYSNATTDDLIRTAAVETDPTVRASLYYQFSLEMYHSACYLWLVQPTTFIVMRSWVNGFYWNMMWSGWHFYHLWKT